MLILCLVLIKHIFIYCLKWLIHLFIYFCLKLHFIIWIEMNCFITLKRSFWDFIYGIIIPNFMLHLIHKIIFLFNLKPSLKFLHLFIFPYLINLITFLFHLQSILNREKYIVFQNCLMNFICWIIFPFLKPL